MSRLPWVVILPLISASPALAAPDNPADFLLATCLGAINDLSKVNVMARENNWQAMPAGDAKGAWTVTLNGEQIGLVTGAKPSPHGPTGVCGMTYPSKTLNRDAFFSKIFTSLQLKTFADMSFAQGRMEMYEISSDGRTKIVLQIGSTPDGVVTLTSIVAMPEPPKPATSTTTAVDGSVRAFRPFDGRAVYVLGTDGKLWREFGTWNNAAEPRVEIDQSVTAFRPLNADTIFVLRNDGALWRESGAWTLSRQSRTKVDGNVRGFKALDDVLVYVLGKDGALWREYETGNNPEQPRRNVDRNVAAFQALNAEIVYVLGSDRKLWREFDTWNNAEQGRQNIDGNVSAFQAIDAETVYVLGTDGNLWREFGAWDNQDKPRVQVAGNVKAFQALDANTIYVLGNDGNLWLDKGAGQGRVQIAGNVLGFEAIDDSTIYVLCPGEVLFRVALAAQASTERAQ
jgi:hypothetical protein